MIKYIFGMLFFVISNLSFAQSNDPFPFPIGLMNILSQYENHYVESNDGKIGIKFTLSGDFSAKKMIYEIRNLETGAKWKSVAVYGPKGLCTLKGPAPLCFSVRRDALVLRMLGRYENVEHVFKQPASVSAYVTDAP